MRRLSVRLAVATLLCLAGTSRATTWTIDPAHSTIGFSVRHMMISNVRGTFDKFTSSVTLNLEDPDKSVVEATIDAASVNTGNAKRDEHLRGADFLDVAKFPQITFKASKLDRLDEGRWKVTGDLTLHGVTKPVTLSFEGPSEPVPEKGGVYHIGGHASTTINRKDFGIAFDKTIDGGGLMVGEQIEISLDLEATSR